MRGGYDEQNNFIYSFKVLQLKSVDEEDRALFRSAVKEVKPLMTDKVPLRPSHRPKPIPRRSPIDLELAYGHLGPMPDAALGDALGYVRADLQKNVLRRLRKGYFAIEAELDLHGRTTREAKAILVEFLHDCAQDGARCVHIIHGKGYRSPDCQPVLKNKLNLWLRQHPDVLAFCSASPRRGGTGAIYVLLSSTQ